MKTRSMTFSMIMLLTLLSTSCSTPNLRVKLAKRYYQYPTSDIRISFRQDVNRHNFSSYLNKLSALTDDDLWVSVDAEKARIVKDQTSIIDRDPGEVFGQTLRIGIVRKDDQLLIDDYYVPKTLELLDQRDPNERAIPISRSGTISWVEDPLNPNPIDIQIAYMDLEKYNQTNGKKDPEIIYIETPDDGAYQLDPEVFKRIPKDGLLEVTFLRYHVKTAALPAGQVVLETMNRNGEYYRLVD